MKRMRTDGWRRAALGLWLAGAALTACSSEVPRGNPYDPDGSGVKLPGRIAGAVVVDGSATRGGFAVAIRDEADVRVDGGSVTSDSEGKFLSPELDAGTYSVAVEVPVGNYPASATGVIVLPGRTTDVGTLASFLRPLDGVVTGTVRIEDSAAVVSGVQIVARRAGSIESPQVALTDSAGAYRFEALAAGSYELVASRAGLTPDLAEVTVAPSARDAAIAPELVLYPVGAVVVLKVSTPTGDLLAPPYARTHDVTVVSLPFGSVTHLRLSESADFIEDDVEVAWAPFQPEVAFTLSAGEGTKTVFGQYSVRTTGGTERLRSEVFRASLVVDETAPAMIDLAFAPTAIVSGGVRYLSGATNAVPVTVVASDERSSIAGIKLVPPGASASGVPYVDVTGGSGLVRYDTLVNLGGGDGVAAIHVQLVDVAGNEGPLVAASVTVDNTAPTVTLEIDGGADFATTPNVTLMVTASDASGLVGMQVTNAGTFTSVPVAPFAERVVWALDRPEVDEGKTVRARVYDVAGNYADATDLITLKREPPLAPTFVFAATTTLAQPTYAWPDVAGVVGYTVVVSGDVCSPCTYEVADTALPTQSLVQPDPLADGALYAVYVLSRDAAGNASSPSVTRIFEVDLTNPPLPLPDAASPAGNEVDGMVYTAERSPLLGWTVATNEDDVAYYEVEIYLAPAPAPLAATFLATTFSGATLIHAIETVAPSVLVPTLADARYMWRARSVDRAGRLSAWASPTYVDGADVRARPFIVDTVPPLSPRFAVIAQRVLNLAGSAGPASDNVVALGLAVRSDLTDVSFWRYEIRGGHSATSFTAMSDFVDATAAFSPPGNYGGDLAFRLSTDTTQNLELRAVDKAGNTSDIDFVTLTEDSIAPAAPTQLRVEERSGLVTLRWTRSASTDVVGYKVYYGPVETANRAEFTGQFAAQGNSPISVGNVDAFTLTGLNDFNGFYVAVTAIDRTESPAPNESSLEPLQGRRVMPRPLAITQAGSLALGGGLQTVAVENGYAFGVAGTMVYAFDITRPAAPVQLDVLDLGTGNTVNRAKLYDGHLYAWSAGFSGPDTVPGLWVIDVRDPDALALVASSLDGGRFFGASAENYKFEALDFAYDYHRYADAYAIVRVENDSVCTRYYTQGQGYRLLKFRTNRDAGPQTGQPELDPAGGNATFTCAHVATHTAYRYQGMTVTPKRVYFGNNGGGILAYKRGVGADPWTNPAGGPGNMCRAAVPANTNDVDWRIIEYCSSDCPDCERGYNLYDVGFGTATFSDMVASGNYLYVTTEQNGLGIVDTSQPFVAGSPHVESTATKVARRDDGYSLGKLVVDGAFLYAASRDYGPQAVLVYDLSNRAVPALVGSYFTPDTALVTNDFAIEGGLLVRATANGLEVARISRGVSFTPRYGVTPAFGAASQGIGFGTHAFFVSSYFGALYAQDFASRSAPVAFGNTTFSGQKGCYDCAGGEFRTWFHGLERVGRFGVFTHEYIPNGPADPAAFPRDPYVHVISLGVAGNTTEFGGSFDTTALYAGRITLGAWTPNMLGISRVLDITTKGRWVYTTGGGIEAGVAGDETDDYWGSLIAKSFIGGEDSASMWWDTYMLDPVNREGHRIAVWKHYAAVLEADDRTVRFFETSHGTTNGGFELDLGATDTYVSASTRGEVVAYGSKLYLGGGMWASPTVEVLDLKPLEQGGLPTQAFTINVPGRSCSELFVSGDTVYCAGNDMIDVYDVSDTASPKLVWSYTAPNAGKMELVGSTLRAATSDYNVFEVR